MKKTILISITLSSLYGAITNKDFSIQDNKSLKLYNTNNSFHTSLKSSSNLKQNTNIVLPSTQGLNNQILKVDNSGNLSWIDRNISNLRDINLTNLTNNSILIYDMNKSIWKIGSLPTVNDTDANLKNRANHTGTQTSSTISDFNTSVNNNTNVLLNTAKTSNITHTGDVSGSSTLTIGASKILSSHIADANVTVSKLNIDNNLSINNNNIINLANPINANDAANKSYVDSKASSVTNITNMNTSKILGRVTSGNGNSEELTSTQVRTLLNVENAATADQTNVEIKTSYESNNNTNAFTDEEKNKLTDIDTLNSKGNHIIYKIATIDTMTMDINLIPQIYQGQIGTNALIAFNGLSQLIELTNDNGVITTQIVSDYFGGLTINDNSDDIFKKWNGNNWEAITQERANHTGTQTSSTISDFDSSVNNNTNVLLNTAKTSNITHTGDVSGSSTLTIGASKVLSSHIADSNVSVAKLNIDNNLSINNNNIINLASPINDNDAANKSYVDSKIATSDIVNNLSSTDTNKPLSANQGKILSDLVQPLSDNAFLYDIASAPRNAKALMLANYNTPAVFDSSFSLTHNQSPFNSGSGFTSTTSVVNSPLGELYETYTVTNASNSFTLHLNSGQAGFLPIANKTYQFALIIRGVGTSVGKQITMGFYKPARVEYFKTLTSNWALHITDEVVNDSSDFNLYVHGTGRSATMSLNEQFELAGYFVLQVD